MKKAILAFTIVAALTSPSFAQSVGEKTGVNSALGIAPKTEDFIKASRHERHDGDRGGENRAAERQCGREKVR